MFIPFYDNIKKQEFRKHLDREFIAQNTAILTYSRALPAFQTIIKGFGEITKVELISINSMGFQLGVVELPADYITSTDVSDGDWRVECKGGVLSESISINLFYLQISSDDNKIYSEPFCRVREQEASGKILLNTGAALLQNSGGFILQNEHVEQLIIDAPVELQYTTNTNFDKFDFSDFSGKLYLNTPIHFDRDVEENNTGSYDGIVKHYEKTVHSFYFMEFLVSRQVCDLMNRLYFFDIVIKDQYGNTYTPVEPVLVTKEREEGTDLYTARIEFKINNKQNLTDNFGVIENDDFDDFVPGEVMEFSAANVTLEELLLSLNTNKSDYLWVAANGDVYNKTEHPIAGAIHGGSAAVFQVADKQGVIGVGVGIRVFSDWNFKLMANGQKYGYYKAYMAKENLPSHYHKYSKFTRTIGSSFLNNVFNGLAAEALTQTSSVGGGDLHENMQPCVGMHYVVALDKI